MNAINRVSACSILFKSTLELFLALRRNVRALDCMQCSEIFFMQETTQSCFKTVLNTLSHCLLPQPNLIFWGCAYAVEWIKAY